MVAVDVVGSYVLTENVVFVVVDVNDSYVWTETFVFVLGIADVVVVLAHLHSDYSSRTIP